MSEFCKKIRKIDKKSNSKNIEIKSFDFVKKIRKIYEKKDFKLLEIIDSKESKKIELLNLG